MKIVFRADSSLQIGTGHIMRCLTLAEELRSRGCECHFICRAHQGNVSEFVRARGFAVHELACELQLHQAAMADEPVHSNWLGASQEQDAHACCVIAEKLKPDWLVVDHYALDTRWECMVRPACGRLLVIDDLADRSHACDLLVDQNLGRQASDYAHLITQPCRMLIGPDYALLRPEFASHRDASLLGRKARSPARMLITMGGVDQPNATGKVLQALRASELGDWWRLTVIMGANAPWIASVTALAAQMPWQTDVVVNVRDMALRMAGCDLVIGAAGSTAWERCCLGVPTLLVVLADNQRAGAYALADAGAVGLVGDIDDIPTGVPMQLKNVLSGRALEQMAVSAARLVDGKGAARVVDELGRCLTDEP